MEIPFPNQRKTQSKGVPDYSDVFNFLFSVGLYEKIKYEPAETFAVKLLDHGYTLNCYCVECGSDSIFQHLGRQDVEESEIGRATYYGTDSDKYRLLYLNRVNHLFLSCSHRHCKQEIRFIIVNQDHHFFKIGQYPSFSDLQKGTLQRYKKALVSPYDDYLVRAIGLHSHGIGIGSYVYLRRIFEHLILEAKNAAIAAGDSLPENFERSSMGEKINYLQHHLPDFLVEHRAIYSQLSLGIHELQEEECKHFFPVLQKGILLILEEKREQKEKAARRKEASTEIKDFQKWAKSRIKEK